MKAGEQGVAGVDVVGAGQAQLLHQAVLQRLVGPLDAALGLGRVGAQDIDVELVQGPAELGHAAFGLVGLVGAEDRMLVAVEGDGLAVILQIGPGGLEISEGALAGDEAQVHQPTGGVVHEYQQGALRAAILEPPVLAAVDLDQLAEAVAPVAGLVDALDPVAPANPDAVVDHPLAQRLDADRQAMNLGQLLGRQWPVTSLSVIYIRIAPKIYYRK
jgi:hypothetical protein